jgi:serine/threonine protein kinase
MVDVTDQTLTSIPLEDDDGSLVLGHTIDGRYRLDSTIGRGGMGLVYKATHVTLRRLAAVKILHPSLVANSDVRNRFEREARASGKIHHDNCVEVYDSGYLTDGSMYLAMELLEGESLADVLQREGQLEVARGLKILAHLLRGLHHIHEAGLVHRDVKPENIFLVRKGDDPDFAKILDFGIAKPMRGELSDDGVKLTQAGMAFGTPIYMAPEQALGNKLDGRADVYAASVVGYEMLAGNPPFYSDDKLEVMSMHTAKPVPPMRHKMSRGGKPVPSSIEKLIVRGLTKKPTDRYASADAMLQAVEAALESRDGGSTDVQFERPDTTGSQPLVSDSGKVRIVAGEDTVDGELGDTTDDKPASPTAAAIGDAIDEMIATAPKKAATPARGTKPRSVSTPGRGSQAPAPAATAAVNDVSSSATAVRLSPAPLPQALPNLRAPVPRAPTPPVFEQRLRPPTPAPLIAPAPMPPAPMPAAPMPPPPTTVDLLTTAPPVIYAAPTLAQPTPRPRWPLYAGIVGVAAIAGIAIAVITSRHAPAAPSTDTSNEPEYARDAVAALDADRPADAQKLLDQNKPASDKDGLALVVRGRLAAAGDATGWRAAVYEFRAALRADPQVATDTKLRASLRSLTASKDRSIVADALDVWIATGDPEAKTETAAAATDSHDLARHDAGMKAGARHPEALSHGDHVAALEIDLQAGDTCAKRKDALAALRALDDPAVVPLVEVVRRQARNACFQQEAAGLVEYFKHRK